jgi:AAA+ ATPase superfamily predicted ATPase
MNEWGFYGRHDELTDIRRILDRGRFFFLRLSGRRRIGKTTLIHEALERSGRSTVFYVQISDGGPAGVLSAVHDAMATFGLPAERFERPTSLLQLASLIEGLIRAGYVVALDEFQYFSRRHLAEFLSFLQAVVDRLFRDQAHVTGGLIVLGSMHAELVALLEDRDAPLYNRTTDQIEVQHLDIASIQGVLRNHNADSPERLLFLWNLFEGVPKFYRDCFEQGVLDQPRTALLERMFFGSSSALRSEADNWFLSELRGRYDVILKALARSPGCSHGDLAAHVREVSPETSDQVSSYLQVLTDRYGLVELRQPIFARPSARSGRYYLHDNFLRAWLTALQGPVSATRFRSIQSMVRQADEKLVESEGHGLERLVAALYAERSRKGLGDFAMTHQIAGFWDRKDTEIDLVALDEDTRTIRFISCKRDSARLRGEYARLARHVERFLTVHAHYRSWNLQYRGCSVSIAPDLRAELEREPWQVEDLDDLTRGLG